MSFLDSLSSMMLPGRRKGESAEERMANDAVDRFIMGSSKTRLVEDIAVRGASDFFSDQDELSEEKTKLEIEMMKRKLGKYRDDDSYEKEMNRDNDMNPLLVAHNARRYAGGGKSLIEHLIGDKKNVGLIQRILK